MLLVLESQVKARFYNDLYSGPIRTLYAEILISRSASWYAHCKINKLTSVFNASVLLLIMNFVITLSK